MKIINFIKNELGGLSNFLPYSKAIFSSNMVKNAAK